MVRRLDERDASFEAGFVVLLRLAAHSPSADR
jgi:hypothetical protein